MAENMGRPLKIWALLGARQGDNNQVLALAEALGVPFEIKALRYNGWRRLQPPVLGATFRSLAAESRPLVSEDWPDLTISSGHRSVPVVQAIREASHGSTLSVHVGYPRISPGKFDLVIATPEYPIADHPNLLRIPFALTRASSTEKTDPAFRRSYPRPRRLLILGGDTLYWHVDAADVVAVLRRLQTAAASEGGSLLVVGSPRTPPALLARARELVSGASFPAAMIPVRGPPSYRTLVAEADSLWVTADSVAMTSDAIATRKPVALVPIRPTLCGTLYMGVMNRLCRDQRVRPRDLRFFWKALQQHQLVGMDPPLRTRWVPDLTGLVSERVKELLAGEKMLHCQHVAKAQLARAPKVAGTD